MFWRKVKQDMGLEDDRSGQRRSLRKGDIEQRAEGAAITSYVDGVFLWGGGPAGAKALKLAHVTYLRSYGEGRADGAE